MKIGVLDIQGSVAEHMNMLRRLFVEAVLTRDFQGLSGLILPGGESTAILGLIDGLPKTLPIYGTCAGVILLVKYGLLDVEVERNAYGGQLHSFEAELEIPILGKKSMEGIFIRAPRIKKVSDKVQVLAEWKSDPVMVRQGHILGSTFHPELTTDARVHEYFLKMCNEYGRTG